MAEQQLTDDESAFVFDTGGGGGWRKPGLLALAVAIVACGAGAAFALSGGGSDSKPAAADATLTEGVLPPPEPPGGGVPVGHHRKPGGNSNSASEGPRLVALPKLESGSVTEWVQALTGAGFNVNVTSICAAGVGPDTVTSFGPTGSLPDKAAPGTTFDLVATPPAGQLAIIPDLHGMSYVDAQGKAVEGMFVLELMPNSPDDEDLPIQVVETDKGYQPSPGQQLPDRPACSTIRVSLAEQPSDSNIPSNGAESS